MDAFHWDDCFLTGLRTVDAQHHQLVDVINRFGELVMQVQAVNPAELAAVFAELVDYTHYHFTDEEAMMVRLALDPRHIAAHQKSHASFVAEVSAMQQRLTSSAPEAVQSMLQFLTQWLAYHILGQDQVMSRQVQAIESGVAPADAYRNDARGDDPATEALLNALNGLFAQVTRRNKELVHLNETLEARVAERTQALTDANQRLDALANTDALTGLPNRRQCMERLTQAWAEADRHGAPLSCIMLDADGFKQVNDTHGHDAGDEVLRALATCLRHSVRNDDLVCRLGGDEFFIICPNTGRDGVMMVAETVRREVNALRVPTGSGQWQGSVSVGAATRRAAMTSVEDVMKAADQAVYVAKRNGRNCVASAD